MVKIVDTALKGQKCRHPNIPRSQHSEERKERGFAEWYSRRLWSTFQSQSFGQNIDYSWEPGWQINHGRVLLKGDCWRTSKLTKNSLASLKRLSCSRELRDELFLTFPRTKITNYARLVNLKPLERRPQKIARKEKVIETWKVISIFYSSIRKGTDTESIEI